MAIITKSEFASVARSKAGALGLRGVVNQNRTFSKYSAVTSVFLSHSHYDKDVMEQAKYFFENLGVSIYVDWADETMPEKPNGVTAQKIKSQIILNDKFILLATNNAISSKWCNWEVGLGDAFKFSNKKIALLPLADSNGSWNGNEYLQIYPRIEKIKSSSGEEYFVLYPDRSIETLTTWLKK